MLKNLLYLTGFSTFVVIVVIALDLYHKNKISSLPPNTQMHVIAIPAEFDTKTLLLLKERNPISVSINEKSRVVSEDSKSTTTTPTTTPIEENVGTSGARTTPPVFSEF